MRAPRARLLVAISLTIGVLAGATPARATTADDKRAEAARIASQRERLIADAERLNEQALASQVKLDDLTKSLATTDRQLEAQNTTLDAISAELQAFAVKTYVFGATAADVSALVDETAAQDVALRRGYAPAVLGAQTDITDQYRAARADITTTQHAIVAQRDQRKRLADSIAKQRETIAGKQDSLAKLATQVDTELSTLVVEEQARQASAADEAAAASQRQAADRLAQREAASAAKAAKAAALVTLISVVRTPRLVASDDACSSPESSPDPPECEAGESSMDSKSAAVREPASADTVLELLNVANISLSRVFGLAWAPPATRVA